MAKGKYQNRTSDQKKDNSSKILLKCPSCGNSVSNQAGRKIIFCSYCGTRLTESEKIVHEIIKHDNAVDFENTRHAHQLEEMQLQDILDENKHKRVRKTSFWSSCTSSCGGILGMMLAIFVGTPLMLYLLYLVIRGLFRHFI